MPSLYLKQDLVNEVEHVALFTSMKRPPYFYERRYPRLFREGKFGWLNKDDIQQFETLKNAVDKYLQSESFKSELEADWTDGFIMPMVPLADLLATLKMNHLEFMSLFLSHDHLLEFRSEILRTLKLENGSLNEKLSNPFRRRWGIPQPVLDVLFETVDCSSPKSLTAGLPKADNKAFSNATKEATSIEDLKTILKEYCEK